jgi:hypothetical protein
VGLGRQNVTIDYLCQGAPCRVAVNQYWTRLTLVDPQPMTARENAGFAVERWTLDAPASPLQIVGAGPRLFDGNHYFHRILGPEIQLMWGQKIRPLNISFQLYATEPFRVTTRVNGAIVSVKEGDRATGITPTISLVGFPQARSVSVSVDCLTTGTGCAVLYFPQVSVISAWAGLSPLIWAGLGLSLLVVLAGLIRLLGLWPLRTISAS